MFHVVDNEGVEEAVVEGWQNAFVFDSNKVDQPRNILWTGKIILVKEIHEIYEQTYYVLLFLMFFM